MDLNLQLLLVSGFVPLIFLYFALLIRSKTSKEAPEPAGAWPVIGHLYQLRGSDQLLYEVLGKMADKYGPAFNIRIGSRRAFVVSSSQVAKECFTTNDRALASRPRTAATKHMCYNHAVFGFAPYSPHWREMRKIVTLELLSNRRFEMMKNVQASEVDVGIKKLYDLCAKNDYLPVLVDLKHWIEIMTLNVIAIIVAGKRFEGGSDADGAIRCRKAIADLIHLMGSFVVSDAIPYLWWLDLKGHEKKMKQIGKDLDAILEGWVEEHRRKTAKGELKTETEQDFVDLMLSLEEKGRLNGFAYDANTSIKATCLTVIIAGSDPAGIMLTWAISLLLNHKFALKKAQEELNLHVGFERQVEESDLKNLVYLQAIVKETFRLYPVAPLSGPREALEDCTIAGYHVPAGTRLIVNVWKIHRDPRLWANPSAFQPERFLTTHVDVDVRSQNFELMPFGGGRRSCPGAAFGLHAVHLILARLLHAFDLATPMDTPIDMTPRLGITIPKATPIEVLLSPRLPSTLYSM